MNYLTKTVLTLSLQLQPKNSFQKKAKLHVACYMGILPFSLLGAFLLGSLLLFTPLSKASENPQEPASMILTQADQLAQAGNTEKAINDYKTIVKRYPFSQEAATAQWQVAQLLQQQGNLNASFKAYSYLIQKYPETPHFEEAVTEQIKIANSFLKDRKIKFLGIPLFSGVERAEEMYDTILKTAPYSKNAPLTQFNLGLSLEKQGKAKEAIGKYQELMDNYPASPLCNDALYQIGYVNMLLGVAGNSQDFSALKEAKNNFQEFLLFYPDNAKAMQTSENIKTIDERESRDLLNIAHFYDFKKAFKASSIYYQEITRDFPQTENATLAQKHLQQLEERFGKEALEPGSAPTPQTGKAYGHKRRLESLVETTALPDYDGPPLQKIDPSQKEEAPKPSMRASLEDSDFLEEEDSSTAATPSPEKTEYSPSTTPADTPQVPEVPSQNDPDATL